MVINCTKQSMVQHPLTVHATQKAGEDRTTDPDMQHVAAAGSSGQHFQFEACEGVQRMAKVGVPLQKTAHADICAHTHKTAQDDIHKNTQTNYYILVGR